MKGRLAPAYLLRSDVSPRTVPLSVVNQWSRPSPVVDVASNMSGQSVGEALDQLDCIRPGKPVESAFIESFNGRLRDECLDVHQFTSLMTRAGQLRQREPTVYQTGASPIPMKSSLQSTPPFDALPPEEIGRLERELLEIDAASGHIFFEEGEPGDWAFLLKSGRVRIQHFRADGKVRTVCMVGPGDTFCCLPTLDGGPYPATAIAAVDSIAYRISGALFRELVGAHPGFASRTLKMFCGRLRKSGCEGCSQADDAPSRIAGQILSMSDRFGERVPLTRKELAELAGTTVETSIRVIKEFERAGWVGLGRGHLIVIDRPALQACAAGRDPRTGSADE